MRTSPTINDMTRLLQLIDKPQKCEPEIKKILKGIVFGGLWEGQKLLDDNGQGNLLERTFKNRSTERIKLLLEHSPQLVLYKYENLHMSSKLPYEFARDRIDIHQPIIDVLMSVTQAEQLLQRTGYILLQQLLEETLNYAAIKKTLAAVHPGNFLRVQEYLFRDSNVLLLSKILQRHDETILKIFLTYSPELFLITYENKGVKQSVLQAATRMNCPAGMITILTDFQVQETRKQHLKRLLKIIKIKPLTPVIEAELRHILSQIPKGELNDLSLLDNGLKEPICFRRIQLILEHSPNLILEKAIVNGKEIYPLHHIADNYATPIIGLFFQIHQAQANISANPPENAFFIMAVVINNALRDFTDLHKTRWISSSEARKLISDLNELSQQFPGLDEKDNTACKKFIERIQHCVRQFALSVGHKKAGGKLTVELPYTLQTLVNHPLFFICDGASFLLRAIILAQMPLPKSLDDEEKQFNLAGFLSYFSSAPAKELSYSNAINRILICLFDNKEIHLLVQTTEFLRETQVDLASEAKGDEPEYSTRHFMMMKEVLGWLLSNMDERLDATTANKVIAYINEVNPLVIPLPVFSEWEEKDKMSALVAQYQARVLQSHDWKQSDNNELDDVTQQPLKQVMLADMNALLQYSKRTITTRGIKLTRELEYLQSRVDVDPLAAWSAELKRVLHQFIKMVKSRNLNKEENDFFAGILATIQHSNLFRLLECTPVMISAIADAKKFTHEEKLEQLLSLENCTSYPGSPNFMGELVNAIEVILRSKEVRVLAHTIREKLGCFINNALKLFGEEGLTDASGWNLTKPDVCTSLLKKWFAKVVAYYQTQTAQVPMGGPQPLPSAPPEEKEDEEVNPPGGCPVRQLRQRGVEIVLNVKPLEPVAPSDPHVQLPKAEEAVPPVSISPSPRAVMPTPITS